MEELKEECHGIYNAGDLPFVLPYDARIDSKIGKHLVKENPQNALVYFNGYPQQRDYVQIDRKSVV